MGRLSKTVEQNINLSVIFTKDKNTRRYIHMKNKTMKLPDESDNKELYRDKIIKLINQIESAGTLEYIYTFLKLFIGKWG